MNENMKHTPKNYKEWYSIRLRRAAPDLLQCLETMPEEPSDIHSDDGRSAYIDAITHWRDTVCASAIAKAKGHQ